MRWGAGLGALGVVVALLATAGCQRLTGGCRKDADCKGDRICEDGACVDPDDEDDEKERKRRRKKKRKKKKVKIRRSSERRKKAAKEPAKYDPLVAPGDLAAAFTKRFGDAAKVVDVSLYPPVAYANGRAEFRVLDAQRGVILHKLEGGAKWTGPWPEAATAAQVGPTAFRPGTLDFALVPKLKKDCHTRIGKLVEPTTYVSADRDGGPGPVVWRVVVTDRIRSAYCVYDRRGKHRTTIK